VGVVDNVVQGIKVVCSQAVADQGSRVPGSRAGSMVKGHGSAKHRAITCGGGCHKRRVIGLHPRQDARQVVVRRRRRSGSVGMVGVAVHLQLCGTPRIQIDAVPVASVQQGGVGTTASARDCPLNAAGRHQRLRMPGAAASGG